MMDYFDEELLDAKRKMERQMHTTLETGIYAGEELVTFTQIDLPDFSVRMPLPDQFVVMPEEVKKAKYPSQEAPALILTSLSSTVNISFNELPVLLKEGEIKTMIGQFQNALENINPSIIIKNQTDTKTDQGNEMSWFEYKGYQLDGQSYNRVYLLRLRKTVLHGTFSCNIKDKEHWMEIVERIFMAVEEDI
ncbi:hypothetical protein [Lacrimispora sp.]|jgi:hypothetical protein|uniref:hypothetical protein n=1 Tax=Lacrimispora sp. TaxID=2719234 RepID=UPI002896405F|nr:hypothetical protein [Lacrimispora sp.]